MQETNQKKNRKKGPVTVVVGGNDALAELDTAVALGAEGGEEVGGEAAAEAAVGGEGLRRRVPAHAQDAPPSTPTASHRSVSTGDDNDGYDDVVLRRAVTATSMAMQSKLDFVYRELSIDYFALLSLLFFVFVFRYNGVILPRL